MSKHIDAVEWVTFLDAQGNGRKWTNLVDKIVTQWGYEFWANRYDKRTRINTNHSGVWELCTSRESDRRSQMTTYKIFLLNQFDDPRQGQKMVVRRLRDLARRKLS